MNDRASSAIATLERDPCGGRLPGIVIHGREDAHVVHPRIQAFIWGGEEPAAPALPYGRRKGAA